jgi:hypothetical protein
MADCSRGFHNLDRKKLKQLGKMREHAFWILQCLEVLIENAYEAAPLRQPKPGRIDDLYRLNRADPKRFPTKGERRLELAIWKQWNRDGSKSKEAVFIPGLCQYVQSYQVPLSEKRPKKSPWQRFDLVAVSSTWLPIVVELKQAGADDTLVGMLVEAITYAIAIRKAWNKGHLSNEWVNRTELHERVAGRDAQCPNVLDQVPVICLAPKRFWKNRFGKPGRVPNAVPHDARPVFLSLLEALETKGLPVAFAQFDEGPLDSEGFPQIGQPEVIPLWHLRQLP